MHWGTFRLTDEPPGEPARRLEIAVREAGLAADSFIVTEIGRIHLISPASLT
jgi:hypothetical protein